MQERRRAVRLAAWIPIAYRLEGREGMSHSLTRNLSEVGMSLLAETYLPPGTRMQIVMEQSSCPSLRLQGTVVWSEPLVANGQGSPRAYESGVEFVDITSEQRKEVMLYAVYHPPRFET